MVMLNHMAAHIPPDDDDWDWDDGYYQYSFDPIGLAIVVACGAVFWAAVVYGLWKVTR